MKTGEELSIELGKRIYQFLNKPPHDGDWFIGTVEQCDDCFGLSVDAEEIDVLAFAKNHDVPVVVYENGKKLTTIFPDDW